MLCIDLFVDAERRVSTSVRCMVTSAAKSNDVIVGLFSLLFDDGLFGRTSIVKGGGINMMGGRNNEFW